MVIASSVLWVSILIAVALTAVGIGCTIAECQGAFHVRQAVRHLGASLKYEVVELPEMEPEIGMIPAPVLRYRVMKTNDQYVCPVCRCPATCSSDYQVLEPGHPHAPRLYTYHCLSGHVYLLRWCYNHWGSYERKDTKAYVAVQKKTAFLL